MKVKNPFAMIECKTEEELEMLQEALRLLNEHRKGRYRWHDIRKNPEDLPTKDGRYLVFAKCRKKGRYGRESEPYVDYLIANFSEFADGCHFFGDTRTDLVIAWREIEPFEEVEDDG